MADGDGHGDRDEALDRIERIASLSTEVHMLVEAAGPSDGTAP